ncbi:MAG: hypothetical protein JXA13_12065 [Anaerolineales bacterium]|nr:hypothetical protein [Anaerolineales bacterium]
MKKQLTLVLMTLGILLGTLACYSTKTRADLIFVPEELPAAEKGKEYEAAVEVLQTETPVGEFILSEGELPPGLRLERVSGQAESAVITGLPTESGEYFFTIYVWCYGTNRNGQTGERDYSILVR